MQLHTSFLSRVLVAHLALLAQLAKRVLEVHVVTLGHLDVVVKLE